MMCFASKFFVFFVILKYGMLTSFFSISQVFYCTKCSVCLENFDEFAWFLHNFLNRASWRGLHCHGFYDCKRQDSIIYFDEFLTICFRWVNIDLSAQIPHGASKLCCIELFYLSRLWPFSIRPTGNQIAWNGLFRSHTEILIVFDFNFSIFRF